MTEDSFQERILQIRLFAFDVDGVLTDGGIFLGESEEMKRFDTRDGAGLVLAKRAGYHVALVTGRKSESVARRAKELAIEEVHQGVKDKLALMQEMVGRLNLTAEDVLFMGDDLPDLSVMSWAGIAVAPANASRDVKALCDYITSAEGGYGAVREIIEMVLRAQGQWRRLVDGYLKSGERLAH